MWQLSGDFYYIPIPSNFQNWQPKAPTFSPAIAALGQKY